MSHWTSTLGLVLAASYMLVAAVPCPTSSPGTDAPRGQTATPAHGHHDHAAHASNSADRDAQWTAPCPCGCGDRGAAAASGGKLGARLIATSADAEPRPTARPLVAMLQSAPRAPFSAIEPIPI